MTRVMDILATIVNIITAAIKIGKHLMSFYFTHHLSKFYAILSSFTTVHRFNETVRPAKPTRMRAEPWRRAVCAAAPLMHGRACFRARDALRVPRAGGTAKVSAR